MIIGNKYYLPSPEDGRDLIEYSDDSTLQDR